VQGLGTAGGFKLLVQDRAGRGLQALQQATDELVAAAHQEPSLRGVFTTFRASTPELYADIDRVKAQKLNVPLSNIFDALQIYLGSAYVNDFNRFGRTFQVRAEAEGNFRSDPQDIERLKTRNAEGGMVPLGSVLEMQWRSGSDRIVRYNMFPAAEVG
jgi:multidrug efflux pump